MNLDVYKNKFIVFEGADSSGKSSTCNLFVEFLTQAGIPVEWTFQPGDLKHGPMAPLLRSFCKDKRNNLSEYGNLFAFLLDRAEDVDKVIRPALKAGKTVVCDRYTYSTIAYQLHGKKLLEDIIHTCGTDIAAALLEWFKNPYTDVKPDIVYYFPERVGNRIDDPNDKFDLAGDDFTNRVNTAYRKMAEDSIWRTVAPGKDAPSTLNNILILENIFRS